MNAQLLMMLLVNVSNHNVIRPQSEQRHVRQQKPGVSTALSSLSDPESFCQSPLINLQ